VTDVLIVALNKNASVMDMLFASFRIAFSGPWRVLVMKNDGGA
jgi:hypothetical protein